MKCRTCARRLDLEKLDYTVGCKHEQMEGFICLACAFEGVAYWMTNISEDDYCEEYVERISNAFPTHECVKPTHECVGKQVTGKLINVEIPTKCESEEAEKQVKGDLISREDAMDILDDFQKDIENGVDNYAEYRDRLLSLPEHVGNSDQLRTKGKWVRVGGFATPGGDPVWKCSVCGKGVHVYGVEASSYGRDIADHQWVACPNCGADMRGGD